MALIVALESVVSTWLGDSGEGLKEMERLGFLALGGGFVKSIAFLAIITRRSTCRHWRKSLRKRARIDGQDRHWRRLRSYTARST